MVTAVVAVCAVLVASALTVLAVRWANERADRRVSETLRHIDAHLEAMSASVARAVDAATADNRLPYANLSLDFDEVVQSLIAEAAARTGADAVVLRVDGPTGRPLVASIGSGVEGENLDRSFGPPSDRHFGSAVIDWTYPPGDSGNSTFHSALVTPLASPGIRGTLVAYSRTRSAFSSRHADAVRALVADLSVPLANARRFAEVEARINLDPATGVPNRRGYELELRRETARAHRTGKPVSVLVVGITSPDAPTTAPDDLRELAQVVDRVARRDDIACMRGDAELAVLLPGTRASGATALSSRIEAEATRRLGPEASAVTVGVVESQQDETADALDARIESSLNRPRPAPIAVLEDARTASTATASTVHSTYAGRVEAAPREPGDVLRGDALEAVASELLAARRFGRSLAVVVLEVVGLEDTSGLESDADADSKIGRVASRLDRSLGAGSAHRLGPSEFALVLPGSGIDDAEALVDALQTALEPPHDDAGLVLSAGVTELAESDDAQAALGRAQHALWQAKQVGPGTVVVAVPGRRPAPPS
jgi:GGDEF domain-containing protein